MEWLVIYKITAGMDDHLVCCSPFFFHVYYCTINLYQFGTIDAHEVREIHTTINAFSTYD